MDQANFLEQFVDKVLHEAELDNLPEEFRDQYRADLGAEVEKRLGIMAMQELPQDKLPGFLELADAQVDGDPMKLFDYLKANIPDFDAKLQTALLSFAKEFVERAKSLRATA